MFYNIGLKKAVEVVGKTAETKNEDMGLASPNDSAY